MTVGTVARRLALSLLALALLAACGRKGEPSPPGPPGVVTYPKAYPPPTGP